MLISGKIKMSVDILLVIAKSKGVMTTKAIASEIGVTKTYVDRFATPMRTAGILKSKLGPGGGFYLSSLTSSTKISNVVDCVMGNESVRDGIDLYCYEQLTSVTLQDIIDMDKKKPM